MPEQSEGNNYASKMIVFPVSYTIFFYEGVKKWICLTPHGTIKSTLWPTNYKKKILCTTGQYTNFLNSQVSK